MKTPRLSPRMLRSKIAELWNANLDLKAAIKKTRIERDNWKRLAKGSKP